jgi:multicomponent Na+:H+ antiporter subunit D
MVMAEAAGQGHLVIWLMLLFASAGVFHHAGIKIPFFAFFSHDSGIRCKEAPFNMLFAMGIGAVLCILIGCFPGYLYALLPYPVDYVPYTWSHMAQQWQILFFSALAFALLKLTGLYPPELRSVNLDVDWSYRRLLPGATRAIVRLGSPVYAAFFTTTKKLIASIIANAHRYHGPQGVFARTWFTSSSVLLITILLTAYLIFYY